MRRETSRVSFLMCPFGVRDVLLTMTTHVNVVAAFAAELGKMIRGARAETDRGAGGEASDA